MSKDKFMQDINKIRIPEEALLKREKAAILQAKKQKRSWVSRKMSIALVSGLFVSVIGLGLVSPGFAETLSKIPVIGPIYAQFNDIASEKIKNEKLASPIDKSDSHAGISMTVKEAVYDGSRVIVTVEYEAVDSINKDERSTGFSYITINGKEPEVLVGSIKQKAIDSQKIIQYFELTLEKQDVLGEKIDIAIHGEDLFGEKGLWSVSFPLEKLEIETYNFQGDITAQTLDKIYTFKVDNVSFSQLGTRIDLSIDYPKNKELNDSWKAFDYSVIDDQGNIFEGADLQVGSAGTNGRHVVLNLPPKDTIPESLTIRPISNSSKKTIGEGGEELELRINFDKAR
ncbi:DUF4179 domain-containing protein [Mesobacillus jeotgali]|uniref:DUF4179 domain-containing protein n=1 Tax=Mesobacillus jeotgali TaxID=129985 RepID=A0ABY9VR16_9BACI|nr:DUF4179 domain-containing protein [Mesobacillus jeotgali]WNF23416.1 DUF4179 domain-containing protein [Mesobacillus jeotgali]